MRANWRMFSPNEMFCIIMPSVSVSYLQHPHPPTHLGRCRQGQIGGWFPINFSLIIQHLEIQTAKIALNLLWLHWLIMKILYADNNILKTAAAGCWHAGKYLMPFSGLSLLLFRIIMTGPVLGFGNIEFSHLLLDHKSMWSIPNSTCWINRTTGPIQYL